MEQAVASWLEHFGAPALFVLLTLGVFGLPLPDETMLMLAGLFVSRGRLRAVPAVAAGAGGAILGITLSFALGRFAGLPLLLRYGSAVRINRSLLARVERGFEHSGRWLLTVGYFLPGVRHLTAIAAGISGLPFWTFAWFAYSGAVLWVASFLTIGYVLGDEWRTLISEVHRRLSGVVAVALAAGIVYALWRVRRSAARRD